MATLATTWPSDDHAHTNSPLTDAEVRRVVELDPEYAAEFCTTPDYALSTYERRYKRVMWIALHGN